MHRASVQPVTLRSEVAVGSFDTSAAELATTGLTDDLVSVQPVPLDLHVVVALADVLLRRTTGSTGAEGLAAARLTTSLEHSTLIAPMLYLTPSVQPVLHLFLHLISRGAQSCTKAGHRRCSILHQSRASDLPITFGCTDAVGIGSSGAADFSRTRPI